VRIEFLADRPEFVLTVCAWHHGLWLRGFGLTELETLAWVRGHLYRDRVPLSLVASHDDSPIGMASIVPDELTGDAHRTFVLNGVFVRANWRGHGVGSALCRRACAEAVRHRAVRLCLATRDKQPLYGHLGWTKVNDTLIEFDRDLSWVAIMERRLEA
jgi:predicted N-acetyltransferase YhbS